MSRSFSLTLRQAIFGEETGEVPVILLTITHPDLPQPIRLSSDPTVRISEDPLLYGTYSRGQEYMFLPFSALLPDDRDESPPQARLVIDNIDRELIRTLRSTSTPAQVQLELVLASSPDAVEIEFPELDLVSADYDAQSVTIALAIDALITEPFPSGSLDPSSFPGLY